jgi:hypothetical protein
MSEAGPASGLMWKSEDAAGEKEPVLLLTVSQFPICNSPREMGDVPAYVALPFLPKALSTTGQRVSGEPDDNSRVPDYSRLPQDMRQSGQESSEAAHPIS